MDGEAGWWTTCGNIGLPPLARVMGVGRQQQQQHHMVEAYSSTGLVMALYVASMVSLCLPHLVEVRTFSMLIVLRALVAARSMCLL